jgi:hypothetical protein
MDELTTELLRHGRISDTKAVIDRMHLRSPAVVKCVAEVLEKEGATDIWSFLTLRAMQEHAGPITPLLLRLLDLDQRGDALSECAHVGNYRSRRCGGNPGAESVLC